MMAAANKVAGPAVDAHGNPAIDPTANVIALTDAAVHRQDDLRAAHERFVNAALEHAEHVAVIRSAHTRELIQLRADFAKELAALESSRLNAIRQVDVIAVNTAADRAAAAIQALAATTAANAENVRTALTNTATTIATQTASTVTAITERLAALEKSSYEGKGRQAYADPAMAELLLEVKALRTTSSTNSGTKSGSAATIAAFLAGDRKSVV